MLITNNISFDNTLAVHEFANSPQAKAILNDTHKGNETQLYNIGQQVISTETSTIRLYKADNAIITDIYTQNGYIYYTLSYTIKRKQYTKTVRQNDITTIKQ